MVDILEIRGHYTLAADLREILADKLSRRNADIQAIRYAGQLRDKVETYIISTLEKKLGMSSKDLIDLLEDDLDKLEEKFNKILSEHLEYKSNNSEKQEEGEEEAPEEQPEEEEISITEEKELPQEEEHASKEGEEGE